MIFLTAWPRLVGNLPLHPVMCEFLLQTALGVARPGAEHGDEERVLAVAGSADHGGQGRAHAEEHHLRRRQGQRDRTARDARQRYLLKPTCHRN